MNRYRTNPNKPSQMFIDSLNGSGSTEIECGNCGRLHLCPNNLFEEEPEKHRKYCFDLHAKNSEGVILHHEDDMVAAKHFNGMAFVIECPCNGLRYFEDIIWEERENIKQFL